MEYMLKPTEEIDIISYKVLSGNTVLYEGYESKPAKEQYDNFVNQNIPVSHTYTRLKLKNIIRDKEKLGMALSEIISSSIPKEIGDLIALRIIKKMPKHQQVIDAQEKFPDYFNKLEMEPKTNHHDKSSIELLPVKRK